MTAFKSDFLRVLDERGLIHQISNPEELDKLCLQGPQTAYVGYDATATSLHIGNLISVTMLYWFQETGHRPITLMGGGTSMVGDPSFRDDQRKLLSIEEINANIESIKKVYSRILRYGDGPTDALMVNNADWLLKLNYVEFLRDVGRHFSVNRMLSFDSVKLRLDREQSLSFLEFNYMIMQGYDFVELSRRYDCRLQMGGSDQWGNIINGVELTRKVDHKAAFGLTTPLLSTASGQKMGKTVGGAVWLNADALSPFDYWQYWRNTEDGDVGRFMRLFTDLPLDQIERYEALEGAEINDAKKALADATTSMLHGVEAAQAARAAAEAAFEKGQLSADLPTVELPRDEVIGAMIAAVTTKAGLSASNGEARRLAQGGGLRLNDEVVNDGARLIEQADLNADGVLKLGAGKKKLVLVRPV